MEFYLLRSVVRSHTSSTSGINTNSYKVTSFKRLKLSIQSQFPSEDADNLLSSHLVTVKNWSDRYYLVGGKAQENQVPTMGAIVDRNNFKVVRAIFPGPESEFLNNLVVYKNFGVVATKSNCLFVYDLETAGVSPFKLNFEGTFGLGIGSNGYNCSRNVFLSGDFIYVILLEGKVVRANLSPLDSSDLELSGKQVKFETFYENKKKDKLLYDLYTTKHHVYISANCTIFRVHNKLLKTEELYTEQQPLSVTGTDKILFSSNLDGLCLFKINARSLELKDSVASPTDTYIYRRLIQLNKSRGVHFLTSVQEEPNKLVIYCALRFKLQQVTELKVGTQDGVTFRVNGFLFDKEKQKMIVCMEYNRSQVIALNFP